MKKKYKFYGEVDLPLPSKEKVEEYLEKFNKNVLSKQSNSGDKIDTEKLLNDLFKETDIKTATLNEIYKLCIVLNEIDSVNVKFLKNVAIHIYNKKDEILKVVKEKNLNNFDKLSKIKIPYKNDIKYKSFFSKFLNRYCPDTFPKYDEIARNYLFNYIHTKFKPNENSDFKFKKNLEDYSTYIKAIKLFIDNEPYIKEISKNNKLSCYDVVDRFIWQFGKIAKGEIDKFKKSKKDKKDENTTNKRKEEFKNSGNESKDMNIQDIINKL